ASNYPRLEMGTLIPVARYAAAFPAIPGAAVAAVQNPLELLNFGPLFGRFGGVITLQPPLLGPRYPQWVPTADEDGLDIAGVRPLQIRVPLGTNTGWNVRALGHRPPNLCRLTGTFIPFAQTRAEGGASGDPRLSLRERYRNHRGFVRAVRRAAAELVHERFLLDEDAATLIHAAEVSEVLRHPGAPEEDDSSQR